MVKNLPAKKKMQEMWVRSLGQEDPLGEGMATRSSILAWRIPMDRGACWATVHGVEKSQTRLKRLSTHMYIRQITNKNLLDSTGDSTQYSVTTHMRKESEKE